MNWQKALVPIIILYPFSPICCRDLGILVSAKNSLASRKNSFAQASAKSQASAKNSQRRFNSSSTSVKEQLQAAAQNPAVSTSSSSKSRYLQRAPIKLPDYDLCWQREGAPEKVAKWEPKCYGFTETTMRLTFGSECHAKVWADTYLKKRGDSVGVMVSLDLSNVIDGPCECPKSAAEQNKVLESTQVSGSTGVEKLSDEDYRKWMFTLEEDAKNACADEEEMPWKNYCHVPSGTTVQGSNIVKEYCQGKDGLNNHIVSTDYVKRVWCSMPDQDEDPFREVSFWKGSKSDMSGKEAAKCSWEHYRDWQTETMQGHKQKKEKPIDPTMDGPAFACQKSDRVFPPFLEAGSSRSLQMRSLQRGGMSRSSTSGMRQPANKPMDKPASDKSAYDREPKSAKERDEEAYLRARRLGIPGGLYYNRPIENKGDEKGQAEPDAHIYLANKPAPKPAPRPAPKPAPKPATRPAPKPANKPKSYSDYDEKGEESSSAGVFGGSSIYNQPRLPPPQNNYAVNSVPSNSYSYEQPSNGYDYGYTVPDEHEMIRPEYDYGYQQQPEKEKPTPVLAADPYYPSGATNANLMGPGYDNWMTAGGSTAGNSYAGNSYAGNSNTPAGNSYVDGSMQASLLSQYEEMLRQRGIANGNNMGAGQGRNSNTGANRVSDGVTRKPGGEKGNSDVEKEAAPVKQYDAPPEMPKRKYKTRKVPKSDSTRVEVLILVLLLVAVLRLLLVAVLILQRILQVIQRINGRFVIRGT